MFKAYVTICALFLGQEVATIDCDEGVPITPFNLDEEMEEGHFDSEGNYFIKKDQEIRDNWLDNIDWVNIYHGMCFIGFVYNIKHLFENCLLQVKIKEQPFKKKKKGLGAKRRRRAGDEDEAEEEKLREEQQADKEEEDDEEEEMEPAEDPLASFTQHQLIEAVVELLSPGETVTAALRRLGGLRGQKRGKLKQEGEKPTEESRRDTEKLDKLTALADRLVGSGMFEIYQHTQEKLAYLMKNMNKKAPAKVKTSEEDKDDELDMFGDTFDETHGRKSEETTEQEDNRGDFESTFYLFSISGATLMLNPGLLSSQ